MSIVYEPLKTALQSLGPGDAEPSAAVAVWLGPEPDGINFIYCADTREERLRLAALLASALCSMLTLADADMQPAIEESAKYKCEHCGDGTKFVPDHTASWACPKCGELIIPF